MIFSNLWRRKTRTLWTMLGIAIGVAAILALGAFGNGIADGIGAMAGSSGADITVAQKEALMLVMSAVDDEVGSQIAAIPGVERVIGTAVGVVQMTDSPYFVVIGEDPRGFAMPHYKLIAGEPIAGKREVLIGTLTARNFRKAVGDRLGINDVSYLIVGVYETGVSFEDGGAVIALNEAKLAFDKRTQVSYFGIQLRRPDAADDVKAEVERRWPDLSASRSGEVTTQQEQLDMFRSFGAYLGSFAVIVGGLGMMNTMLMSVLERTREIGVLRAVGWRRSRVLAMIIGESLVLSLLGGLLGVLAGYGLTAAAQLSATTETLLPATITPDLVWVSVATAAGLGLLGGTYPALRAARLEPADAMRRESGAAVSTPAWVRVLGSGALRNVWRQPCRTLVTIAGLGIGVGLIVALTATSRGFSVIFQQLGAVGQLDLMVEEANASDASFSVIDESVADRMLQRSDVAAISKILMGFTTAPGMPYVIVFGIDENEDYVNHYRITDGARFGMPNEIIMGRFAARSLKREVGDWMSIASSNYRIVGIYENGVAFEDAGVAMSLLDAQKLFRKPRKVSFLGVRVYERENAAYIARALEEEFPEVMVAQVATFTERMNDIAVMNAMLGAIVVLSVVVGSVVITNAMVMSVFERTHEIGVLRALGWSRWRVIRMIVAEAIILSAISAAAGIGLALGLTELLKLDPAYGVFVIPVYSAELFAQAAGLTIGLGIVGSIGPALRSASLPPIEALRYE